MAVTNNNWFNINSTRRYPLDDKATGESDDGMDFPNDIITDMRIRFPESRAKFAAVSGVNCTKKIITVTISGCFDYPVTAGEPDNSQQFTPLAVVSLPKPVIPGVPYAIRPVAPGVYGWIVFGEGLEKPVSAKFSRISQSIISPRAALPYKSNGIESVSVNDTGASLSGDVLLKAIGDLNISYGTRIVQGVGEVKAIIFRLSNQASSANLFEKYVGKCQGRPESESCKKISVEYLNNIQPDCNGNINLSFESNQLSSKRILHDKITGLAVEMPLGMAEACTRNDFLPDSNGKLPNEYADVCKPISDAEGDQDIVAVTSNRVSENPSLSSSVLEPTSIPYLGTLINPVNSVVIPSHFELISGSYFYKDTGFNIGLVGGSSVGLATYSTGSRFAAVWNDPANDDRTYQKDYPPVFTTGSRVSVSFIFAPGSVSGTAGVITDCCTVYSESCGKYLKVYIIGVLNIATKRLEIHRWTGSGWILTGRSNPIPGLVGGTWYTIDFQKDMEQTSGTKVQYRLNLFKTVDYWSNLLPQPVTSSSSSSSAGWPEMVSSSFSSSSSAGWPEMVSSSSGGYSSSSSAGWPEMVSSSSGGYSSSSSETHTEINHAPFPAAGYSFSMSDYSLAELTIYSESYGSTDCLSGFGTVKNGSITFSYFFVG